MKIKHYFIHKKPSREFPFNNRHQAYFKQHFLKHDSYNKLKAIKENKIQ